MNYYAIQIRTGSEEQFIKLYQGTYGRDLLSFFIIKRYKENRKGGKIFPLVEPLCPGYLIIQCEGPLPYARLRELAKLTGFFALLREPDRQIRAIQGDDLALVQALIGAPPEPSKVWFDENDKLRVFSGQMKGLERRIVSVDKRKRRAKVRTGFLNSSTSWFIWERMEKTPDQPDPDSQ